MGSWLTEHKFTRPREPMAPIDQKAAVVVPPEFFWDAAGNPITGQLPGHVRLWTAYKAYTLAYACMLFRATKMAEAPLWILDETADGDEWLEGDHVLGEVLKEPNLDMDMADLVELTSLYLDTAGLCIWHKTRDGAGRVRRLYPYHRDEVQIEPANGRLYGRFTLMTTNGPLQVDASEVILFKNANPSDLSSGLGPLDVALSHVNIGNDLRRAITAMLRNAIKPSAKVETPNGFATQEEFERFRSRLTSGNGGVDNTGKLMILEGGAKFDLLSSTMKDVDMGPVQGDVEAAICQVFQVHPTLAMAKLGVESNTGFADTIEPATDLFYDVVAIPRWRRMERALTRQLLREADDTPDRRITFDTTKVRALQDDLGERTTEATQAAGYWTVNEARSHTGQQPLPAEDERGEQFVKQPTKPDPNDPNADDNEDTPAKQAKSFGRREAQRLIDSATRESEESLVDLVAKHQLQLDEMAIHQVIGLHAKAKNPDHEKPLTESEAQRLTEKVEQAIQRGIDRWKEAMHQPLEGIGNRSIERLSASLGVRFDLLQPGLLAFVEREAAELVTHVSETTRETLKRVISQSLEHGDGIRAMAQRIRDTGVFGPDRAKLIAITETTRTRNGASLESMQHFAASTPGLVSTKEWLNSGDNKVRTAHKDHPTGVGRERVQVDQPFSNGLMAPGEPNCRCSLLFDVDTED